MTAFQFFIASAALQAAGAAQYAAGGQFVWGGMAEMGVADTWVGAFLLGCGLCMAWVERRR